MNRSVVTQKKIANKPPRHVIHAGEFLFTSSPTVIETLLGSCIAITMWHPERKLGGMCHFALPHASPEFEERGDLNGRYALDSVMLFKKALMKHNLAVEDMIVKVFGGGDMSRTYHLKEVDTENRNPIGHKNASAAFEHLMNHDFSIVVGDIGEFGYRKVKFDLSTGDVWVKFVGEKSA